MDSEALKEYQRFIDQMVSVRESLVPARLREGRWGLYVPPSQQKFQDLLERLSSEDRELVAQIVQDAVDSAVHDALKVLTENEYKVRKGKVELPWEPYGTEMYFDFVARVAKEDWPAKPSKP